MYVKSLRVAGFKSFADPTILDFESGVNVIVGPNGSGKSNIADALSWVLGSQAPSSLRGASMEDVIFAGSAKRPKLAVAEVQLILDNSDRILPLDLAEVTISRSTDRTGASEYKINGAPCRLLDIAELLSDTGIGRSLHTVVGQGQLDAVLQAKPEDRRTFIEEAAQIGKFRRRKDRSLRKIERVDENLTRLNDVLSELRRAIRPLKRQANAAGRYTELLDEHTALKQRITAHEVRLLKAASEAASSQADEDRLRLLADELSSVRARLERVQGEREELARAAERAASEAHRMARAVDRLTALGRLAEERAATISARLAAETEEGYRERIRLLETDRARWAREVAGIEREANEARTRADRAKAQASDARNESNSAEGRLAQARAMETEAAQSLVRAEGAEAAAQATLGSVEARVEAVVERIRTLDRKLEEDGVSVERAEQEIKTIEAELDAVTERAARAETVLEEKREHAERLRDRLASSNADRAAAQGRLDALTEVDRLLVDIPQAGGRLAPLLEKARSMAEVAELSEGEAKTLLSQAEEEVEVKWGIVADLDEELRRLDALMSGGAERLAGARRQREAREVELTALNEELARTRDALASAQRSAAEERAALPERRSALEQASALRAEAESALDRARSRLTEASDALQTAELEARTVEERALGAQLRLEESEAGIADAREALEGLADRRASMEEARTKASTVAQVAIEAADRAGAWVVDADAQARRAQDAARAGDELFTSLSSRERDLNVQLDELTRLHNEAEIKKAEARARTSSLAERAMDEWGLTLDALEPLEGFSSEMEEDEAREQVARLERQMKNLGAINPHAAEEFQELSERERFLEEQMEDLRVSKRDLMKVVREVDETIVEVFRAAYEEVAAQFEQVFDRLFPGGQGRLKLTDPTDLLATGIEVEARPPGKNVRKLSLLSGGERSLVALCFLFSIFRARPSPFYLLDEVEAALDDINLQRFVGLVDELEERAQVLIVTHQKRTMEAADVLYGVSMSQDGVTQVVAKRMEELTL